MSEPKWTREQLKAIQTSGRDVYVTASAGTGKTAVLSARCIELMNNESGAADISEFVVLTFTEAAAEEMTTRIGQLLRKMYAKSRDKRLKRQLLLLDSAQISTIHSFCQSLIREHFYVLGIDPVFGIVDEDEQKLIKARVLKEVADEAFADEALAAGINVLLKGRDLNSGTAGFLDEVIKIHEFLDSSVDRDKWYEAAKKYASEGVDGELGQRQREIIIEKLKVARQQLELMGKLDEALTEGNWSEQLRTVMMPEVEELIEKVTAGKKGWQEAVCDWAKPKFKNKPKGMDDDIVKAVKKPGEKAFETIKSLRSLAIVNPRYEEVVAGGCAGQTYVMIELVKRFEARYRKAKEAINCLDFADLEHYALKLLSENEEVAAKMRSRFKFVFVDEFQDVNRMQDRIIGEICRGDNLFVVGDVKQSIYAFRHSDPSIFIEKLGAADGEGANKQRPVRVDLSDNFRSRAGVLEFANVIFRRIMAVGIGGIEYDDRAELRAGFEYASIDGPMVCVDVIDETAAEDEKKAPDLFNLDDEDGTTEGVEKGAVSAAQKQAAMIAKRIRQLIDDGAEVYDKGEDVYRPVRYGDIVVLMRSPAGAAREYVELFRKAGIPVRSQASAGYFEATEITDMLSLLKVLDNPQRDVELAAVMRSPLFGFDDTELAMVRGHGDKIDSEMNFYQCAAEYSQDGSDEELRQKVCEMLAVLDEWRSMGRRGKLADLVWKVYRQTGYLAFCGGIVSGAQRRANLLKLHDRAIQFEGFAETQSASLGRFVEFVEELLDGEHDWAPAEPERAGDEAVQIMSVHKSKGLEYPVVFLAETNRRFNMQDARGQCLADKSGVLGLKVIDSESGYGFKTIGQQVIAEEKAKETMAEEMRVLYVAMTRARERLYVCTSKKRRHCAEILRGCDSERPMDFQVGSVGCLFDWVLYGLGGYQEFVKLFEGEDAAVANELFEARVHDSGEMEKLAGEILYGKSRKSGRQVQPRSGGNVPVPVFPIGCHTDEILQQVKETLGWEYEYADETRKQAKTSVTELTHKEDEFAEVDYSAAMGRVPEIVSKEKTSGALAAGIATHLLIGRCIVEKKYSAEEVKQIMGELAANGLVSEEVAGQVNVEAVAGFFDSELGDLLKVNTVHSEWPFTVQEDGAIVQGIIDCVVLADEGVYVIDFKTDRDIEKRREKYIRQINYYAGAAEKILGKKVVGKFICYLNANEIVEI